MSHFETFRKSQTPFTREPHVTIQRRGTITINAASYALLGSPGAVELLFDPTEQVLGLRAVDVGEAHAVFVRPSSRSRQGPWVLSAMAFVHHYRIDTSQARRWVAQLDNDTLVVRLRDGGRVVSKQLRASRPDAPGKPRPRPRPVQPASGG
ncbi:hypothetical protein [uncultured Jatrophihabitans sp.]|uniref:hypothetical protein n=1 Tax=uncultured Jatrophihabitans sp. TaxID=1610747 RepID=UPI0035CAFD6A